MKKYSDYELLNYIKKSAENNYGNPNWKDFKGITKKSDYPSLTTIENRFNSWSAACALAGFNSKINRFKYSFTDKELLDYLKLSATSNSGYPKQADFTTNNPNFPGMSTIKRRFGSWSKGCELAGFTRVIKYKTIGDTLELLTALEICFDKFNYTVAPNRKNIDKNKLLTVMSNSLDIPRALGFSCSKSGSQFLRRTFPDKPHYSKNYQWLLLKNNWLCCTSCKYVKSIDNFYKNNNQIGYNLSCRRCQEPNKVARSNIRRVQKISATVAWADLESIKRFYSNCPEGYVVDHIIPLQGRYVCGLHVLNNLQYLLAAENNIKSNYHESEEYWK